MNIHTILPLMKTLLLVSLLSNASLFAEVINIYHPPKEPKGLYLVDIEMGDSYSIQKKYRIYCPTAQVRDISSPKWDKARDVKVEDHYKQANGNIIDAYHQTCKKKASPSKKFQNTDTSDFANEILIIDEDRTNDTAEILIKGKGGHCIASIESVNTVKRTDCIRLTNSKNIKILCTKKKEICKTEKEIFEYMEEQFASARQAMIALQMEDIKNEVFQGKNTESQQVNHYVKQYERVYFDTLSIFPMDYYNKRVEMKCGLGGTQIRYADKGEISDIVDGFVVDAYCELEKEVDGNSYMKNPLQVLLFIENTFDGKGKDLAKQIRAVDGKLWMAKGIFMKIGNILMSYPTVLIEDIEAMGKAPATSFKDIFR